jgi:hypothetical protein
MDVDRVFNSQVDKDNVVKNRITFNKMTGNRLSAMEHLVPEQMFSTPEAPAQGISAVKAIALASAAGQKIWTITQDNLDVALAAINLHADSETEIRNGVNAGNVVTAHEQSINFNGWVGEGYIIVDPTTGAGAYKIAGGGNGGLLAFLGFALLFAIFTVVIIAGVITGGVGLFAAAWAGVNFYFWTEGMKNARNYDEFNSNNLVATLALMIGFLGLGALGAEGLALLIFADAMAFLLSFI